MDAQAAAWMDAITGPLATEDDPQVHWDTYRAVYAGRLPDQGPAPAWLPPVGDAAPHRNLHDLAEVAGVPATEGDLHRWSTQHRAAYWDATLAALGIQFVEPPVQTLAGTAEDPVWLEGARLNVAATCFQAPADRPAIVQGDETGGPLRTTTYGELKALADQVSHGLLAQGLQRGDAVALYLPMNTECVAAYLGIVQAGLAVVSIPDSFAPAEVATRLRLGGAKMLLTVSSFQRGGKAVPMAPKALEAAGLLDTPVQVVALGDAVDGCLSWDALLVDNGAFAPVPCDPQDVTNILFSSGTTGEPKAIPWTNLTPIKAGADGRWHQDIHAEDVVAWPTNIGWMMGPWLIYATFLNGATMALYEGVPTGDGFVDFVNRSEVTMLGVVPAIVRAWKGQGLAPHSLHTVRVFSSTGEASNAPDYLYLMGLASYRAPVIEYCGGTEIGGGHLTGTLLRAQAPATFSTPGMGIGLVVLDDDHAPVPDGGMGEVFLIPPSMGLSQRLLNRDHHKEYYAGTPPGPSGETLRRHGDEVLVLHQGYWAAGGRADDTMNLGGIKVSSIELENAMNGHPAVVETAAVSVIPEGGGADQLVVFAVLEPGAPLDGLQKELQDRIKRGLNPLFRILDVVVVDTLPRTASNKVMRRELRAQYRPTTA